MMQKGYEKLRLGMSRGEVIGIFGCPDSEGIRNGITILGWETHEWKGVLRGGRITRSVEIEIQDDKVISYNGHNINMSVF
jgi:hypothetical protein